MYRYYLKSAIRTLWNNKGNTAINIIGISIGLACCIIISLHVYQEFSFDKFHKDRNRIFQVCYQLKQNDKMVMSYLHSFDLSRKMKEEIPQLESVTAFRFAWNTTIKYNNQYFQELLALTEPDFFSMFSFKILSGNPKTLLRNPNDIVITLALAKKLTGQTQNYNAIIGKTIEFPNNMEKKVFTITGILDELPASSSIRFNMLIQFDHQNNFSQSNNEFGNTSLYLKVKDEKSISQLSKIINPTILSFYANKIKDLQENNVLIKTIDSFFPVFLPLSKTHLDSPFLNDYIIQGNKTNLYILLGIGVLILFVGCCNFILLSLGQVMKKTKNIDIQKVSGAKNINIFRYFFAEVNILVFIALAIALLLSYTFLPLYAKFANTRINNDLIFNPAIILILLSLYLLIVCINSIAPVLFFSRSKPAILFRKNANNRGTNKLPLMFVTLQYSLSIFLIICSLFIASQVNYMKHKNLGFTSENVLYIPVTDIPSKQRMAFRDRLKINPGIINVAATNMNFSNGRNSTLIEKENGEPIEVRLIRADENYIQTLGLQLIEGRNFTAENMNEKDRNLIVNEKFLASLDIKDSPVGRACKVTGEPAPVNILGVIKNFHFDSMKENLQPMALTVISRPGNTQYLLIKFHEKSTAEVMAFINSSWDQIVPDRKAQISFWDKKLESRYKDEERWSQIVTYASMLSIFIASLGLFGLTILLINRKTKEIGVRKVNGARIAEVMAMLNSDFVKWVAFAFVIACPIAWYAMHKWLQNFAYKTELSWWVFASAGIIAMVIALLTVSWQSWRAATRNPVESLRYE